MNWYKIGNDLYCEETFVRVDDNSKVEPVGKHTDTCKRYFKSNESRVTSQNTIPKYIAKRIDYHVGIIETIQNEILKSIKIRTELGWITIQFNGNTSYNDYNDPIDMLKDSPDVIKVVRVYEGNKRTEELYNFYMQLFKGNYSVHFAFAPCCKSGDDYCYIIVLKTGLLIEKF